MLSYQTLSSWQWMLQWSESCFCKIWHRIPTCRTQGKWCWASNPNFQKPPHSNILHCGFSISHGRMGLTAPTSSPEFEPSLLFLPPSINASPCIAIRQSFFHYFWPPILNTFTEVATILGCACEPPPSNTQQYTTDPKFLTPINQNFQKPPHSNVLHSPTVLHTTKLQPTPTAHDKLAQHELPVVGKLFNPIIGRPEKVYTNLAFATAKKLHSSQNMMLKSSKRIRWLSLADERIGWLSLADETRMVYGLYHSYHQYIKQVDSSA